MEHIQFRRQKKSQSPPPAKQYSTPVKHKTTIIMQDIISTNFACYNYGICYFLKKKYFRKILKHPVRSVTVLGSKKRVCIQAYRPPVEGACLGFLSIKLLQ